MENQHRTISAAKNGLSQMRDFYCTFLLVVDPVGTNVRRPLEKIAYDDRTSSRKSMLSFGCGQSQPHSLSTLNWT